MIAATTPHRRIPRDAIVCAASLAVLLVFGTTTAGDHLLLSPGYPVKVVIGFVIATALLWRLAPPVGTLAATGKRYGAANAVTHTRLAVVALLGGLIGEPEALSLGWPIVITAALAAAADGIDGAIARAHNTESGFGARFDMEVDALLILVLCALAWQFDRAGAWVFGSGLMRYLFVFAARPWPWLANPLPSSRRRKLVCVLQVLALITCLLPVLPRSVSSLVAAIGLALLAASFAIDLRWLHMNRQRSSQPAGPALAR